MKACGKVQERGQRDISNITKPDQSKRSGSTSRASAENLTRRLTMLLSYGCSTSMYASPFGTPLTRSHSLPSFGERYTFRAIWSW